jgi:hypothetical protein
MRPLAVLCVMLAGCGQRSVCDEHDGTCVELTIHSRTLIEVTQLGFTAGPPLETGTQFTDLRADGPRPFPIVAAIHLPPGPPGDVPLHIDAFLGEVRTGSGSTVLPITRVGLHFTAVANVERVPDAADARTDVDDTGIDLASPVDGALGPDLSFAPDLAGTDLNVVARRVFLIGPLGGNFAASKSGNARCKEAWEGHSGRNDPVVALLGGVGSDPKTAAAIQNGSLRPVLLPSGTQVAVEGTFLSASHAHAVDELVDGAHPTPGCVWTAFSAAGTHSGELSCIGWTAAAGESGASGQSAAVDQTWAVQGNVGCEQSCYVYCLTQ